MKVGELFVELGIDADTPKAKEFQSVLNSVSMESIALVAALTAVSFKLRDMLEESMNASVGFKLFRNQSGLSSEELQRWQIVAERANVSTEAVASSILSLQRNIANVRLGRGDIRPYQLLGIDPFMGDPFEILTKIREELRSLDPAQALNIMEMFGISPEMINIMTLTNTQFKELSETSGLIFSQENQENALKLKRAIVDLKLEMKAASREGVGFLSPELKSDLEFIELAFKGISFVLKETVASWRLLKGLIPGINIGQGYLMGRGLAQQAQGAWNRILNKNVKITVNGTADPNMTAKEILRLLQNDTTDQADAQINNEGY